MIWTATCTSPWIDYPNADRTYRFIQRAQLPLLDTEEDEYQRYQELDRTALPLPAVKADSGDRDS